MTNFEFYKDEITNTEFAVVKGEPRECSRTPCENCLFGEHAHCSESRWKWLKAEYEEPKVDWTAVGVDTPILVSADGKKWRKRYFARHTNNLVYVWGSGATSWSVDNHSDVSHWTYTKLAEVKDD